MAIGKLNGIKENIAAGKKKTPKNKPVPKYSREEKIFVTLSYIGPFFLVTLLYKPESDFAQFHAHEGFKVFLLLALLMVTSWFPIIGILAQMLSYLVFLGFGGYGIYLIWQEKMEKLPVLDKLPI